MGASSPHRDLVERAGRWLRNTRRLPVVLLEIGTDGFELPDVLGFDIWGKSWVIECKVSRADFLADLKKPFRVDPTQGMGAHRLYVAPPGIIHVHELPAGWGLVLVKPKTMKMVAAPGKFELPPTVHEREKRLLMSAVRRLTEGWGQRVFAVSEDE